MGDDRIQAGIYCRMSLASMDDHTKVDDQERICRDLARRLGWKIAGAYVDNNRSAWQKNRKRPGWEKMLADIRAARLTALIIYHGDRLIRQPRDLEDLIDLADGKGIRLAAPTGMRNLDNYDDRKMLRVEAAFACGESDNTSRRRKDQYARWRLEGRVRPGGRGGRAYGFATDGITHIPAETAIIIEAAQRVLAGQPTLAIARDLTARGYRTQTGGPFTHGTLRKMLARPRYAGLMPDGASKAAWDTVLDRETWEAVAAVLDGKAAGFTYATNARRWLLSGLAECAVCGSPLAIKTENRPGKTAGYRCIQPGCRKVQRSQLLLDEYVITRTLARLGNPANPPGRLPDSPALAAEFRDLTGQRKELEGLIADHTKGNVVLLLRRLKSVDTRLAELRGQVAGNASRRLMSSHIGMTREEFDDLPLATRRALVAACFTVTVLPASRRGPGFNTDDVVLTTPGHG